MLRGGEGDARKATERMSFIIVLLIDMFVLLGRSFGCRIGKRGVLCCLWLMFLRTEVTRRMVETPRLISLVCCAGINIDGVLWQLLLAPYKIGGKLFDGIRLSSDKDCKTLLDEERILNMRLCLLLLACSKHVSFSFISYISDIRIKLSTLGMRVTFTTYCLLKEGDQVIKNYRNSIDKHSYVLLDIFK
ncbi:hypothetical protein NC653_024948 [Populus alba x Populus x berolinensis]|uniref:Uncharacterized protein n=1 Tax=Populus alba x Populus x berolinensis TaxID=444605 RepID=A0AAD6MA11_9ROSI|nr:hypothetical protein NC653_024948 [Populus alba x Populus x berolinensis]